MYTNYMLEIQKRLLAGETPDSICTPLGINWKEENGEVLFSYDQIEAFKHKNSPVVRESRGLILNRSDWSVASYGFNRFFNKNEPGADELPEDLAGCYVTEKLDGSYIALRWSKALNSWQVSTRNMLRAEGTVNDLSNKTFAQLFWEGADKTKIPHLIESDLLPHGNTFIFELTSIENRIVTRYLETKITLITIRDTTSLAEFSRKNVKVVANVMNVDLVNIVPLSDWKTLLDMEKQDNTFEGYVVVKEVDFGSHLRVKVKNPAYLRIARLVSSHSQRAFMELIKRAEHEEWLSYYPEYKEHVQKLLDGLHDIEYTTKEDWARLGGGNDFIGDIKAFALQALKCKFPSLLFTLKDGKVKVGDLPKYIAGLRTDTILDMIERAGKDVKSTS